MNKAMQKAADLTRQKFAHCIELMSKARADGEIGPGPLCLRQAVVVTRNKFAHFNEVVQSKN